VASISSCGHDAHHDDHRRTARDGEAVRAGSGFVGSATGRSGALKTVACPAGPSATVVSGVTRCDGARNGEKKYAAFRGLRSSVGLPVSAIVARKRHTLPRDEIAI